MQARFDSIARVECLPVNEKIALPDSIAYAFSCAIREALLYVGRTAPNPPVGCVILDQQGEILATAAHHQAGMLHAEALALQECRAKGVWHKIYDVIVTLEPCNHKGRTAPCSEALLQTPARRIWVGVEDPNPDVCGAGNERIRQGGKEVFLLKNLSGEKARHWQKQCEDLVAPFVQFVTKHKAWITVKQAIDESGSMIPPKGQKTFTSFSSLCLAHQLRRGTEAIITGSSTIKQDWPSFTVRHVSDHAHRKRLLVVCTQQVKPITAIIPSEYLNMAKCNGFLTVLCHDLTNLASLLYEHQVIWGMVEGGPKLLQAVQQKQIWDEWLTFRKIDKGEDQIKLRSNHSTSPTRLFLSHSNFENFSKEKRKGDSCSLVS